MGVLGVVSTRRHRIVTPGDNWAQRLSPRAVGLMWTSSVCALSAECNKPLAGEASGSFSPQNSREFITLTLLAG